MGFYEWKNEYSCGITGIDDQHKIILTMMTKVHEAITCYKNESAMKEILIELLKYANYHFELEIKLLKKHHYLDEAKHVEEHNHYIEKVKTLMIHDYLNNKDVPLETLEYLKKWFTNHMLKTDMDYCKYLAFKSVTQEVELEIASDNILKYYGNRIL